MDGGGEPNEIEMQEGAMPGGATHNPGEAANAEAAWAASAGLGGEWYNMVNAYLFQYFHVLVMGGILTYYVLWPKLMQQWNNVQDRKPVGGHYKSNDALPREERMRLVRERQAERVREVGAADAEVRQVKAEQQLEEEKRKQDERNSIDRAKQGTGRKAKYEDGDDNFDRDESGGQNQSSAVAPTRKAVPKKKDNSEKKDEGNPKKLPKLPGSGQQGYEPFPSGRDGEGGGGGGRFRPTGFSRPSKGG